MDIVTYCNDTAALVKELEEKFPERLDINNPDNPQFLISKAPGTIRNGAETLALLRVSDQEYLDIQSLESLTILGTYDQIFFDSAKKAIYDRVYDQSPKEIVIDDKNTHTYIPPQKFVVFA